MKDGAYVYHKHERTQLLLKARAATHGEFYEHSYITQELKAVMRKGVNWHNLTCVQKEALEMIVHKLARILSGDPNHIDHYSDVAGYAELVVQKLTTALELQGKP